MDEKKLVRLAEKFMALDREFLELIRDLELEYDDDDDDLNLEDWAESEDEIPPCR